jgi:hypothetical protein
VPILGSRLGGLCGQRCNLLPSGRWRPADTQGSRQSVSWRVVACRLRTVAGLGLQAPAGLGDDHDGVVHVEPSAIFGLGGQRVRHCAGEDTVLYVARITSRRGVLLHSRRDPAPVRLLEDQRGVAVLADGVGAVVMAAMVKAAQRHQIGEVGGTVIGS